MLYYKSSGKIELMEKSKRYLVRVDFLDHVEVPGVCERVPVYCTVYGVWFEESKKSYSICFWCADLKDTDHNSEAYLILKDSVLRFEIIREEPFSVMSKSQMRRLRTRLVGSPLGSKKKRKHKTK